MIKVREGGVCGGVVVVVAVWVSGFEPRRCSRGRVASRTDMVAMNQNWLLFIVCVSCEELGSDRFMHLSQYPARKQCPGKSRHAPKMVNYMANCNQRHPIFANEGALIRNFFALIRLDWLFNLSKKFPRPCIHKFWQR